MEFHLVNHPLDCPVCDQAGECWLQIYYMQHGLYDPRMIDEKVHKPKAVPLGPHVMLDAERCILCSRCVRFCDEITETGELGIFNRGDHSEIGLFPGTTLDNNYSGNVVDICPVGALTDRDFRFQVRVWYLDTREVDLHRLRARLQHRGAHEPPPRRTTTEGRRVARLKPRFNADVNQWWICDEGRYGFGWVDAPTRLDRPGSARRSAVALDWDEAVAAVGEALRATGPRSSASSPRPRCPTRTCWRCSGCSSTLGIRQVDFAVPPARAGRRRRLPDPRRQESQHARRRADRPRPGRRRRRVLDGRAGGPDPAACGSSTTTCSPRACRPPT